MKYTWWLGVLLAGCPVPNAAQFEDDLLAISPPQAEIFDISDPDPCGVTVVTGQIGESMFFGQTLEVTVQIGTADPAMMAVTAGSDGTFEVRFEGLDMPEVSSELDAVTRVRWGQGEAWDTDTRRVTTVDVPTWYDDADMDGFGAGEPIRACEQLERSATDDDCAPGDGSIHPGAEEIDHDGIDQDCDGSESCFIDGDGDGFHAGVVEVQAGVCALPAPMPGDCNDTSDAVNPDSEEVRDNGIDEDCDGSYDCSEDVDGDGFTVPVTSGSICTGVASADEDCDDSDDTLNPGAVDVVHDGIDQDCDGFEDCYIDADSDGYHGGLVETVSGVCAGGTPADGDCDDAETSVNPGTVEVPDNPFDDDCDGWFDCAVDSDLDGFTVPGVQADPCTLLPTETDCDDEEATVNPGETDVCGRVDSDCAPDDGIGAYVGDAGTAVDTFEDALAIPGVNEIVLCEDVVWTGPITRSTDLVVRSGDQRQTFEGSLELSAVLGAFPRVSFEDLTVVPGEGTLVEAQQGAFHVHGGFVLGGERVTVELTDVVATCPSPMNIDRGGVVMSSHALVVSGSLFTGCGSNMEGGVAVVHGSLEVSDSEFIGNFSQGAGGALSVRNGPVNVSGGLFQENTATFTGAMHLFAGDQALQATLTGVEFDANIGDGFAGGIFAGGVQHQANVDIIGGEFRGNSGDGSVLALASPATASGTGVVFGTDNHAPLVTVDDVDQMASEGTFDFDCAQACTFAPL